MRHRSQLIAHALTQLHRTEGATTMNTSATGIPSEQYDHLDVAADALHLLCSDPRFSFMERAYLEETRNRLNLILLTPREGV